MKKTVWVIVRPIEDQIPVFEVCDMTCYQTKDQRDENFLAWESDIFKAELIIEMPDLVVEYKPKLYDLVGIDGPETERFKNKFFKVIGLYGESAWVKQCNVWGEDLPLPEGPPLIIHENGIPCAITDLQLINRSGPYVPKG